jgi:hypothetical protein
MSKTGNLLGESLEEYKVEPPLDLQRATSPAKRLKPIDRKQVCWGTIDIEKLIEPDHPVRGIWAMVMQLDLKGLEDKIRSVRVAGQSSLDPRLLMALWIYGYSEGIGWASCHGCVASGLSVADGDRRGELPHVDRLSGPA